MEYVRLGATGLEISRLCLGTLAFGKKGWRGWALSLEESLPVILGALEAGINFIDTANYYSDGASEEVIGEAVRRHGGRDSLVIATKVYRPMGPGPNQRGLSRKHILASVDASLRRLGTDYIDLLQIHRWDANTPVEETLSALDNVVKAGKVRYLGAGTMYSWQLAKARCLAQARGWEPFVSFQCHHNLVYRTNEIEVLPFCEAEGIGVLAYSPLARGLLANGRRHWEQKNSERARTDHLNDVFYGPEDYVVADRVQEIALRHGRPGAQIALAWVLQCPAVSAAIVGPSRQTHLDDYIAALNLTLSADDIDYLEEPIKVRKPVLI